MLEDLEDKFTQQMNELSALETTSSNDFDIEMQRLTGLEECFRMVFACNNS